MQPGADTPEAVVELAANVDDATGETLGHAAAALLAAGALDAWLTPIQMKKGRPGTIVSALVREADAARLSIALLRETGSFGVRRRAWERTVVERSHHEVDTVYGPVSVKLGTLGRERLFARPEADGVAERAAAAGVPFRVVMLAAEAASRSLLSAGPSS
ncbi:nickel insertion protein [Phycisphaera mikurensis]|uniref:DUF111 family protein n=1 Tax=Phycisphaera mikurensis (strain NBRC 102666 / KCTC 22515 / FYK2301M01) TaxID=1142394 RepID=I0IDM5_PHYMF|nr:nickel insertion protein [Phycisphaera mikurensis]MBB6441182.1 hypothetical protein [Phycisphaera mikurensis]BAM03363.1 hypothetical protein PSMK_12040 [Phycisphaera mikurensis NBRC 102666]